MAFPFYATGTVSVAANGTVVTGVGVLWSATNTFPGDDIVINGVTVVVMDYLTPITLSINPWPSSTVSGTTYKILPRSPYRQSAAKTMMDVSTIVAALNTDGYYFYVAAIETVPNPSYGNEGQYAMQATTGKLWIKSGGVWVYVGINKGVTPKGAYNGAVTYNQNDLVSYAATGSSYLAITAVPAGSALSNTAYWMVIAAQGATGATGNTGAAAPAYGGTSTTSLVIGTGAKAFVTQAGLAYTAGARVRASSGANWMEGVVTYTGTALTITVDKTFGSGTLASWTFNIAGEPGAGNMSSANALSELTATAATARANIGAASSASPAFTGASTFGGAVTVTGAVTATSLAFSGTAGGVATTVRRKLVSDGFINIPGDFATMQLAMDYASQNLDGGGRALVFGIAPSATVYPTSVYLQPIPGTRSVLVYGTGSTKQATKLARNSALPAGDNNFIFQAQNPLGCVWTIYNIDLDVSGCPSAISLFHSNVANITDIYWHGTGSGNECVGTTGCCNINLQGNHSIESLGTNSIFGYASDNSFLSLEPGFVGTIVGTPTINKMLWANRHATISTQSATWVNGANCSGQLALGTAGGGVDLVFTNGTPPGTQDSNWMAKDAPSWIRKPDQSYV